MIFPSVDKLFRGCVKRLCDNAVAMGRDVSNYDELITCLKDNCRGIEIYGIGEPDIQEIQRIVDQSTIKAFKGTLKIHQVSWSRYEPDFTCPAIKLFIPHGTSSLSSF